MPVRRLLLLLLTAALALPACSDANGGGDQLTKRGRTVYQTNCTACHARNPAEKGPVGPPVAGASLALVEAKVLHNTYPPGYTPKRDTEAMVARPDLRPDLPAIAAYLESVEP